MTSFWVDDFVFWYAGGALPGVAARQTLTVATPFRLARKVS